MAQCTIIYPGHYDTMDELTDEQAGILIKTIGKFHRGEDVSITDPIVKGVWLGIKHDFIAQKENYEQTCERNRENGKKGGRPKNPKNPSGLLKTQPNPQNLKEKEKEKEKDKKKDINKAAAPRTDSTKGIEVGNFKTIMSESDFYKVML